MGSAFNLLSRHNPGVGMMPQRVHRSLFVDTGGFQCLAKSDLNAAIAYRCRTFNTLDNP